MEVLKVENGLKMLMNTSPADATIHEDLTIEAEKEEVLVEIEILGIEERAEIEVLMEIEVLVIDAKAEKEERVEIEMVLDQIKEISEEMEKKTDETSQNGRILILIQKTIFRGNNNEN